MSLYKGYVYLIEDVNSSIYKIGVTRTWKDERGQVKRLKALQTGNSSELKLSHIFPTQWPFRLETMLHNRFKKYHVSGEWYNLPTKYVDEFNIICVELDNTIKSLLDNPFFNKNIK